MIHYKLTSQYPSSHYIDVELTINDINTESIELQLPAWRPGRYELGNFAKNIKSFQVFDQHKEPLKYNKQNKDCWLVKTKNEQSITVTYSYYTNEINAGNCYADEEQIYINPVHLCLYIPKRMNEAHTIEFNVPSNFSFATSLLKEGNKFVAQSYDELADSPVIASSKLQSDFFEVNGIKFWLHFNGECKPDWHKIKTDFIKFTETQIRFWGDFPVNEYHYLFQILPYKFYHGVEHQKSTVIALGAGYNINNGITYENLLGVSSHELFHTWNIKYIRPTEMLPYDFTKENYARTGFVYEGFTTYYGDVILLTSGVFNTQQYFETLEERLQKHFHNHGRFNLSVADSSFDTWLDGYVPGAPYRKTSIYDEGNLIAFMLDVLIMKHTHNKKGLKDVCRVLYNNFAKQNKGYNQRDIIMICEDIAGTKTNDVLKYYIWGIEHSPVLFSNFFSNYVYGTKNYEIQLNECFDYLGIEMQHIPSNLVCESLYGFKTNDFLNNKKVSLIAPNSPSWNAGLSIGDEIIAVNGYTLKNDFNDWMTYFKSDDIITLTVSSNQQLKTIELKQQSETYYHVPKLKLKEQCKNFEHWMALNG